MSARGREAGRLVVRVIRGGPGSLPRIEEHSAVATPGLTIGGLLDSLNETLAPLGPDGAIAWGPSCADGTCGRCTLLVNGVARAACLTPVDAISKKNRPITLAPLSKFPVVRDLVVDKGRLDDDLRRTHAALPSPPRSRTEPAPTLADALSRCTGCAACLEACPEYGPGSGFVGPAVLGQLARRVLEPDESPRKEGRLDAAQGRGVVSDCGKSENCVEVCPAGVPVVDGIETLARLLTARLFERRRAGAE